MAGKVLVVDDEKMIVKGIKFSLIQDYSVVDCAYDGEEALDMAKNNDYDIILLDIMLPSLNLHQSNGRIQLFLADNFEHAIHPFNVGSTTSLTHAFHYSTIRLFFKEKHEIRPKNLPGSRSRRYICNFFSIN